ncbi:glycosyltransferase family 2 protein [Marilutibacter spongiae]|uniref:Glycosyltransferase family 2 protein n=1 Tax=Marilutibacter spongiae TaxID=2025720 RepID=A0A7W3TJD1_9GAMM|nr:glycosyltransferase family 2 protein [Lysobacter spongiae]MBB1059029.1 glycosyltransferase family 2 protein [Lysobacter spongiae]
MDKNTRTIALPVTVGDGALDASSIPVQVPEAGMSTLSKASAAFVGKGEVVVDATAVAPRRVAIFRDELGLDAYAIEHMDALAADPPFRIALAWADVACQPESGAEAWLGQLLCDRSAVIAVGWKPGALEAIASKLASNGYLVLAAFDEERHHVLAPVANAIELERLTCFLAACPLWSGHSALLPRDKGATACVAGREMDSGGRPGATEEREGGAMSTQDGSGPEPSDAEHARRQDELIEQIRRMDDRLRQQVEANRRKVEQLASELRLRVATAELRHEALLNGRVFGTLRRVARLLRLLSPLTWVRSLMPGEATAAVPAATQSAPLHAGSRRGASPGSPAAVQTPAEPAALPSPQSIRIAGVSYMSRPEGGVSAADIVYPGNPLITVVMTTFDTEEFVEAAVRSILDQTWKNLELIVVDDCSRDSTRARVEAIAKTDPRVKLYCYGENRGTYWCKNFGITRSNGDVVTFMDSDDISEPKRLELQFEALNRPGIAVSTCNHVRKDEDGKVILINGVAERVAYISQMVKRKVFDEMGYFDTIRTSADDEFLRRLRITYGQQAQANVKEVLYIALLRDGSLTRDPANAINFVQQRNSAQSFLSPQRRHYAAMCDRWHKFLVERKLRPYVPFPVVRRPFPVFGKLVVDGGRYDGNIISACLASYPPREEKLREVVAALLPQVDHLYVYLNEYEAAPEFLRHSRITVVIGSENLRDNGKFHFIAQVPEGYCLTVDDDIAYPPDYVQSMIRKLEFYERKVVVGLHGTVYSKPIRSFFRGRTLLHFEEALAQDTVVNQLGTGTVAFHTSLWRPERDWFRTTGMADVWLAVEARRRRIPLVAVERAALWLAPLGVEETTLFREFRKNDELQTRVVKELSPWREELSNELALSVRAKTQRLGAAYARLLPRLGVAADAPTA